MNTNVLKDLVEKYNTDKKDNIKSVLEIGSNNSLKVWRDYFPNAQIHGVDVSPESMIEEDRIKTYLFDASKKGYCEHYLKNLSYDVIVDNGNGSVKCQIETLENLFNKLNNDGIYFIENVKEDVGNERLMETYLERFKSVTNGYEIVNNEGYVAIVKSRINKSKLTIVSGLWNINRVGRSFDHYLAHLDKFLEIDANLFLYLPKELEPIVWKKRSRSNTFVKIFELEDLKKLYAPFWDKTQKIRTNPDWYNLAGWLSGSPQASLEWYNPIVQSKMFLLNDVTIWNPFNTEHFIWLDAGINNTVNSSYFIEHRALDKILPHLDSFLFLSYPYEANNEIHGFEFKEMNRIAGQQVKYVCRGGLFGGHKSAINRANGVYYSLLNTTLSKGLMGTEESIFTLMSYLEPENFRRYALDGNGLIVKFIQALIDDKVTLEPLPEIRNIAVQRKHVSPDSLKTSVYMLTFNFPHQLENTIKTWLKHPKWLTKTRNILIDNSTSEESRVANAELCKKYNFEHLINNKNTGINGGRFKAAQHFQESDSDYYVFLEDDMCLHEPVLNFCRNGFRTYVPDLYDKLLKIIDGDPDVDFLKISYTEVYMDNNIQVSWYNVPQKVRTDIWPTYNRLPVNGLDPNCPRTKFDTIEVIDGLSYIKGEVYYANWPMILGKRGNKKMFLDTTWTYPYEQTWMSHMFQETRKGNLKPAVLLASPINHNRIAHYKPEERKENSG